MPNTVTVKRAISDLANILASPVTRCALAHPCKRPALTRFHSRSSRQGVQWRERMAEIRQAAAARVPHQKDASCWFVFGGIKSRVSRSHKMKARPKRGTHHSRGKSLVKLASPLSPRVPTPGRRKTGSGWPSDNRTWCQCLRRHDLNSVSDSAKIRWIDIIVNRR